VIMTETWNEERQSNDFNFSELLFSDESRRNKACTRRWGRSGSWHRNLVFGLLSTTDSDQTAGYSVGEEQCGVRDSERWTLSLGEERWKENPGDVKKMGACQIRTMRHETTSVVNRTGPDSWMKPFYQVWGNPRDGNHRSYI
jgi:hypothetical protein